MVREGYIGKGERPDCEAITTFMTPALIILFNVALGLASPALMVTNEAIIQRAVKLAVPIGLCRYLLGKDPEHPYKICSVSAARLVLQWSLGGGRARDHNYERT